MSKLFTGWPPFGSACRLQLKALDNMRLLRCQSLFTSSHLICINMHPTLTRATLPPTTSVPLLRFSFPRLSPLLCTAHFTFLSRRDRFCFTLCIMRNARALFVCRFFMRYSACRFYARRRHLRWNDKVKQRPKCSPFCLCLLCFFFCSYARAACA